MTTLIEDTPTRTTPVDSAVADIASGRLVVLVDDAAGESMLLLAAVAATKRSIATMVRHGSGFLRAPMTGEALDRLRIPPMLARHQRHPGNNFAVSVDASHGITTGISGADRAHTFQVLADPASEPDDLIRPGHVIPERAEPAGGLQRPGRAEAALSLIRIAGLPPVGVLDELVGQAGQVLSPAESALLAQEHGLTILPISDLALTPGGIDLGT